MARPTDVKIRIRAEDKSKRAINQAKKNLAGLQKSALTANKAIAGFGAVIGSAVIFKAGSRIAEVSAKFETLGKTLETLTGSTAAADAAFNQIREFAATTPFQLDEVVQAFIRLKSLGLDPSEEALTSYGNTAAAMGKSIIQFVEAIADATTGEFERLKDFGIKAKTQGDKVTFAFRGISTEVDKTAESIESFLRGIGNETFGTAMADQADTAKVAFSNLDDAIDQLLVSVGESSGLNDALKDTAIWITNLINSTIDGPAKVKALREELERLEATGGRGRGRNRTTAGGSGRIASAEQNLLDAVKAVGGEQGIRQTLAEAEERLDVLLGQSGGGKRSEGARKKQVQALKIEIESLQTQLADVVLDFSTDDASAVESVDNVTTAIKKVSKAAKEAKTEIDYAFDAIEAQFTELDKQEGLKLAGLQEPTEAQNRAAEIFEETRTPLENLNAEIAEYNQLLADGELTSDTHTRAVEMLKAEYEELANGVNNTGDQMSIYAKRAAENTQDIFAEFLFDPFEEDGLEGMLDSFTVMLRKMAAQAAAAAIFDNLFSSQNISGFSGAISGFFSGSSGGAPIVEKSVPYVQRASGGPLAAGQLARVGEDGEEWFQPRTAGTIIPNNAIGGQVTVNVNNAPPGTTATASDSGGTPIIDIVLGAVASDIASNGVISRALDGSRRSRIMPVTR